MVGIDELYLDCEIYNIIIAFFICLVEPTREFPKLFNLNILANTNDERPIIFLLLMYLRLL